MSVYGTEGLYCDELSDLEARATQEIDAVDPRPWPLCERIGSYGVFVKHPENGHSWKDPYGRAYPDGGVWWIAGMASCWRLSIEIAAHPGNWERSAFAHELVHAGRCDVQADTQHEDWTERGLWGAIDRANARQP